MREIKFRAWDKESMVYFDLDDQVQAMGREIMQFTGLKDKNGKEIYEGDILKASLRGRTGLSQVIWEEHKVRNDYEGEYYDLNGYETFGKWTLKGIGKPAISLHTGQFEIIGNIYENKELLN